MNNTILTEEQLGSELLAQNSTKHSILLRSCPSTSGILNTGESATEPVIGLNPKLSEVFT